MFKVQRWLEMELTESREVGGEDISIPHASRSVDGWILSQIDESVVRNKMPASTGRKQRVLHGA